MAAVAMAHLAVAAVAVAATEDNGTDTNCVYAYVFLAMSLKQIVKKRIFLLLRVLFALTCRSMQSQPKKLKLLQKSLQEPLLPLMNFHSTVMTQFALQALRLQQ